MIRQADKPCPVCGGFYRDRDHCTRCGSYQPVPKSFYTDSTSFSLAGKPSKGRQWDSKKHKYVS
ncbi:MAG TPA: hypothetical protein VHO70_19820 [Chitinispirillaceae bacterium]|nr:hypothetical protein [Chitinispirillaceae bacterium]